MAFKLGMTVDLYMAYYIYMLVSMTVTLMQGHSGSAEAKIVKLSRQLSKQQALNLLQR